MNAETKSPVGPGLWETVAAAGRRCLDAARQGVDAVGAAAGGDVAGAWRVGREAALSCTEAVVAAGERILKAVPLG